MWAINKRMLHVGQRQWRVKRYSPAAKAANNITVPLNRNESRKL